MPVLYSLHYTVIVGTVKVKSVAIGLLVMLGNLTERPEVIHETLCKVITKATSLVLWTNESLTGSFRISPDETHFSSNL